MLTLDEVCHGALKVPDIELFKKFMNLNIHLILCMQPFQYCSDLSWLVLSNWGVHHVCMLPPTLLLLCRSRTAHSHFFIELAWLLVCFTEFDSLTVTSHILFPIYILLKTKFHVACASLGYFVLLLSLFSWNQVDSGLFCLWFQYSWLWVPDNHRLQSTAVQKIWVMWLLRVGIRFWSVVFCSSSIVVHAVSWCHLLCKVIKRWLFKPGLAAVLVTHYY